MKMVLSTLDFILRLFGVKRKEYVKQLYLLPVRQGLWTTVFKLGINKYIMAKTLTVTSNTGWSVDSGTIPSWLTLDKASGTGDDTVQVTASVNTDASQRTASLVFITADRSTQQTVVITQAASQPVADNITLSPASYNSIAAGDSFTLQVTASTNWSLTKPSWATLSAISGSAGITNVTVTVVGNTGSLRTGTITGIAGTATATCTLAQDGVITNPVISLINGNSLATVTAIVVLYPGSYNWNDSFQYDIPPGATYDNVSKDNLHGDFMAGSDYMIYWKGDDGTSGSTYAPDLQNGSAYSVG